MALNMTLTMPYILSWWKDRWRDYIGMRMSLMTMTMATTSTSTSTSTYRNRGRWHCSQLLGKGSW